MCAVDVDSRVRHDSSHFDEIKLTQDDHTSISVFCDVTDHVINLTSAAASRCSYHL